MILLTAENGFLSSLTEGNIVVIVIVVIAAIAGFLLLGRLLHVLVHLSYIMSQASSLFSAAKTASENEHGNQQYGGPPQKSLNDVTRLLLPLIQKDFPDFSWKDFQKQTENCIASVLRAYDRQDVSVLASGTIRTRGSAGTILTWTFTRLPSRITGTGKAAARSASTALWGSGRTSPRKAETRRSDRASGNPTKSRPSAPPPWSISRT